MKRYSSAASLALAGLAVLGLSGPVAAGDHVPFKGSLEGVVTITPLTPPFVSVSIEATGKATHLGKFTLEIPHIVNRSNGTAVGSYQFVAANGDTLTADFTGQATPTSTPGVLYIEETATITGGTGRFAHATGSFLCERLFDTVAGTTTVPSKGPSASTTTGTTTDVVVNRRQRPVGSWPRRQASASPAQHRPGARSARRSRCPLLVSQTSMGDS